MSTGAARRAAHLGPARRRPLVLDAALSLFAEHGYAGASMDAVAAAAGVTKPVVYACFPGGKTELFGALLQREEERINEMLATAAPTTATADPESAVQAALTAIFTAVAAAPDSFRIVYVSPHGADPAVVRAVARGRQRHERRMVEAVRHWGTAEEDAELLGRLLVAAGETGLRLLLEDPGRWPPEALAQRLTRLLMRGAPISSD